MAYSTNKEIVPFPCFCHTHMLSAISSSASIPWSIINCAKSVQRGCLKRPMIIERIRAPNGAGAIQE